MISQIKEKEKQAEQGNGFHIFPLFLIFLIGQKMSKHYTLDNKHSYVQVSKT